MTEKLSQLQNDYFTKVFAKKSDTKFAYWVIFFASLILISLNILRILKLSVTYDEAFTYFTFVTTPITDIVTDANASANNHILSTLLTKFSISFGDNVFFLRFTSLFAQALYLYFSFRICALLFNDRWMIACAFFLLNMHPFLFEFWGLCRGYGLAISLCLGSIYFLLLFFNHRLIISLCWSLFFCIAAIYANFAMLNLFPAVVALVMLYYLNSKPITYKVLIFPTIVVGVASGIIYGLIAGPIAKLIASNSFFYGGENSFFYDTIQSLVQDCFYLNDGAATIPLLSHVVEGSTIVFSVYVIWLYVRKKNNLYNMFFTIILIIPFLSTELQHHFLGTRYLISRTALFFLPLYLLFLLANIATFPLRTSAVCVILLLATFSTNFIYHYNISETRTWPFDRYDYEVMKKIKRENTGNNISLGSDCLFWPGLKYYSITYFKNIFYKIDYVVTFSQKDTVSNYYYIEKKDLPNMSPLYKIDTIFDNEYVLMARKINK